MKNKFLTLAFLVFANMTFASEDVQNLQSVSAEKDSQNVLYCRTARAYDEEGNEVAAASCCRQLSSRPTGAALVALNVELDDCANKKLEYTLAGN